MPHENHHLMKIGDRISADETNKSLSNRKKIFILVWKERMSYMKFYDTRLGSI